MDDKIELSVRIIGRKKEYESVMDQHQERLSILEYSGALRCTFYFTYSRAAYFQTIQDTKCFTLKRNLWINGVHLFQHHTS
jgi:hypothetical protein